MVAVFIQLGAIKLSIPLEYVNYTKTKKLLPKLGYTLIMSRKMMFSDSFLSSPFLYRVALILGITIPKRDMMGTVTRMVMGKRAN